jgi:glycosyltransferase involved in cell wall biosynthesis
MMLGLTFPYLRVKSLFSGADNWGASVSHHDLVRCSLQFDAVEAVHFFVDPRNTQLKGTPGVDELRAEFGASRVVVQDASNFARQCARGAYVFPAALGELDGLFSARDTAPRDTFPICLKVHTVPNPQIYYTCYLEPLLLGKEHDAMVVTTLAGRRAVEAILDGVLEHVESAAGARPTRRFPIVDIPHGVDEQFLAPRDRAACRRMLDLPPDGLLVLYTGRFTDQFKADLDPLLAAFLPLARARPDAALVLAGREGPERYGAALRGRAAGMGIGDRLHLLPNFPYFLKPAIYAAADIFVSPVDNVQETFGLALLEAMASGLPIVASDWSGYRELVADGETGHLIPTRWHEPSGVSAAALPPLDAGLIEGVLAQRTVLDTEALSAALLRLALRPEERRRMGDAGRRRVLARFTWRSTVAAYAALWREQRQRLLRARYGPPRLPATPDFNGLFAGFATRELPVDAVLACTSSGSAMLGRRWPQPLDCPGGIAALTVRRVLAAVAGGRLSLRDIATTPPRRDAVTWLLKKGHLRFDATPAHPSATAQFA